MKLLTFQKKDDGLYYVSDYYQHKPTCPLQTKFMAKELCRMRLEKRLQDDNLNIFKIPFIDLWLVW